MARGREPISHIHLAFNSGSINQFNCSLMLKQNLSIKGEKAYSIMGFVDNFSVRQSLLRYSMSLELSIRDSAGLVDESVMRVGSVLILSLFRDPADPPEAKIEKYFYITHIDNSIQSTTPNERVYDITAFTYSGVSNAWPMTKVYGTGGKAETGDSGLPSDIIKDIVKTRFTSHPEEVGEDTISWIPSEHILDTPTIFKQVAPFDAITNMLRRCTRTNKDSTYFFYEDKDKYKLRTIGDMTKQEYRDAAFEYTMRPDKKLTGDIKEDYYKVLYLTQHNNSNYFSILENGIHSSEVVYIDLLNRTVGNNNKINLFNYSDEEHRKTLLNIEDEPRFDAFDLTKEIFEYRGFAEGLETGSTQSDEQYDLTPASKIVFSENAWDRKDYVHEKYPYDVAQRALFEQNKITIEVYGNPQLRPGDMVKLVAPKETQQDGQAYRISGLFLITAVKHNISGNRFQTIVDLHKDSYETDVLTGSKDNSGTQS
jgi:hypothetical protein